MWPPFEDSVCTKGKCVPNKKKAKGLVLGVSSFDAALPASGIAVWKVNDWFLRESLPAGAANLWLGEDLRDHQYGLSLVESDGVLSMIFLARPMKRLATSRCFCKKFAALWP